MDDIEPSVQRVEIDLFYLPPKPTADKLVNSYMKTVQPLFSIFSEAELLENFEAVYDAYEGPKAPVNWLIVLNLVFAIGRTYHTLLADGKILDTETHDRYFSRARLLGALDGSVWTMADLRQVQTLALAGMYMLASHRTNR